jgi:HEAT repeat protein
MKTFAFAFLVVTSAPALAQHVESVDPRIYLQTRAHEPNAVRELSTKLDVAVVILRDGVSDAMLAPRAAYPAGAKDADVEAMRVVEARALMIGAIHAVAKHKPEGALALLDRAAHVGDAGVRAEAAEKLGELGDVAVPAIARAARDDDASVREAAMSGLGKVRSARALDALAPFVRDGSDARTQSAAIRAAGAMTSKWAWQARGDARGADAMRTAVTSLLASVQRTEGNSKALDHVQKVWLR